MMRRLCNSFVPPIECSMMWSSSGELGCLLCLKSSHALHNGQVFKPWSIASALACLTSCFHSAVPVRDVATVPPPCCLPPGLARGVGMRFGTPWPVRVGVGYVFGRPPRVSRGWGLCATRVSCPVLTRAAFAVIVTRSQRRAHRGLCKLCGQVVPRVVED